MDVGKVKVFVKLELFTSGSSPSLKKRVSVKRCHNACIYYRTAYSSQKTWKIMKISWFFEEISSQASPATLSVTRECCLGHFSWKIFSSIFQLSFWTIFFAWFHQKSNDFHRFCLYYHAVAVHNHQVCFKKHEIFNEIEQKTWFKIGVGKLMKIFFMWNVPNNIPWPLKVSPVISETIFPRKPIKNACGFMFRD